MRKMYISTYKKGGPQKGQGRRLPDNYNLKKLKKTKKFLLLPKNLFHTFKLYAKLSSLFFKKGQ